MNEPMHRLKLFVAPGSCLRVPAIALEEIGAPYETQLVRFPLKEQKTPEFLAINPKGKVPALLVDGQPLTENVAILTWLNQAYPEARLLPEVDTGFERARQTADLATISGTIHPIVTRIALPARFVGDGVDPASVRAAAINAIHPLMTLLNARLSDGNWWYGQQWSVVDAYIFWAWWRLSVVDYPGNEFANLINHAERIQERPAIERAMSAELDYARQMRSDGLFVPHKDL